MLFPASPLNLMLAKEKKPIAIVTDIRSDTSAATTYTFSACQVNIWPNLSYHITPATGSMYGVYHQSLTYGYVAVVVHQEDSASNFSVGTLTLGGVNGTEIHDRGGAGAGVLVNTAYWIFPTETLQNITNTDIVVTSSEAITGCAIVVLAISNIAILHEHVNGQDTTFTSEVTFGGLGQGADGQKRGMAFCFSTVQAPGEAFQFRHGSASGAFWQSNLLYEVSNANFAIAGAWLVDQGDSHGGNISMPSWTVQWSAGTTNADAVSPFPQLC